MVSLGRDSVFPSPTEALWVPVSVGDSSGSKKPRQRKPAQQASRLLTPNPRACSVSCNAGLLPLPVWLLSCSSASPTASALQQLPGWSEQAL